MNIADFITELYCKIDDARPDFPYHPQAVLSRSEVIASGVLYAVKTLAAAPFTVDDDLHVLAEAVLGPDGDAVPDSGVDAIGGLQVDGCRLLQLVDRVSSGDGGVAFEGFDVLVLGHPLRDQGEEGGGVIEVAYGHEVDPVWRAAHGGHRSR